MDVELRWGPALYRGFIGDLRAAGLLAFTAEPKVGWPHFFHRLEVGDAEVGARRPGAQQALPQVPRAGHAHSGLL
eukprot:1039771-Pyramimonas_sp.AAC.1